MPAAERPVLYLIACGGRAAAHLVGFVELLRARSWDVCVVATPQAVKFMDLPALRAATGHVVRHEYKHPDEPDVLPPADVMVVAPATFNTVNKLALGISDTLALGLLNEAVGLGLPIVAVPTPNQALARHPAFVANLATLRSWGIRILFDPREHPLPAPAQGAGATDLFPWAALAETIGEIRSTLA